MSDEAITEDLETVTDPEGDKATEENPEVAELRAELERYKAKQAEAEKHRKEAEKRAREIERERQEAERRKAEEEGNHQKLWETEKERAERLEAELAERDKILEDMRQKEVEMARDNETTSLVSELTSDAKRQKALKKLVKEHVQLVDGEKQYVVDGVTIDKSRFVKYIREEYPSLVDGSGMSGGGALGANGVSGATTKGQEAKAKGDLTGFLQAQLSQ